MLRVVLPVAASISATVAAATSWLVVYAVPTVNVAVAVEIVIVVNCDVVVSTPPAAITPAATPCSSHGETNSEGDRHSRRVISWRWIGNGRIGIDRRTINDGRIVAGDINDLWIGLLNYDDLFRFHHLGFYFLLFRGFQVARSLCLFAHALHSFHDIALLRQECVAQICSPLDVIR
jgi:hypothetical protein